MTRSRTTTLKNCLKTGFVLAAALLLMTAGQARADVIFSLVGVTPGADFTYTYNIILTGGSTLHPAGGGDNTGFAPSNNFITLYDIPGFVPGSETYAGLVAANSAKAEKLIGDTAPRTTPVDSGAILNITTYWTGADVSAPLLVDLPLGTLSFHSLFPLGGTSQMLFFTGATQNSLDLSMVANNIGQVAGPALIPEPATLALLAVGLPVVGGLYYRRRNQKIV